MSRTELDTFIDMHKITMTTQFVPYSKSRSVKDAERRRKECETYKEFKNLNWIVTLYIDGRKLWSGDYGSGQGACPSYKHRMTPDQQALVDAECEVGHECIAGPHGHIVTRNAIQPRLVDVLASLALDSRAVDHDTFESWAGDYGYSTDSRWAYATYQACIDIAVALRVGLGDLALQALVDASMDY